MYVWCAQAFQDGLEQCEATVAQSKAGLRRKESVLSTGPGQGMATVPHANGSGAAAGPPADPKPLTQTGNQKEVQDVKPNSAAPDAQDTWHTVSRRPSAAGKDPRAAMAAVRAQLQVTYIPRTCTCQQLTHEQLPSKQVLWVRRISRGVGISAEQCRVSRSSSLSSAGECKCSRGGRAAGTYYAAAPRG